MSVEADRLKWQCRRGMLELDHLLLPFLEKKFDTLSGELQNTFKQLLEIPDNLLLEILLGRTIPFDKDTANVARQIRETACT
jgi:antitoxin CptB